MKQKLFDHYQETQQQEKYFLCVNFFIKTYWFSDKTVNKQRNIEKIKLYWYKFWKPTFYKNILQNFIKRKTIH